MRTLAPSRASKENNFIYGGVMNESTRFITARDLLLRLRQGRDAAEGEFSCPQLSWVTNYFDVTAARNSSPVLRIVDDNCKYHRRLRVHHR
jgi:hypothetical protein